MGLSASQARLLSITARLSDNELKSQQISNSKVRLADRTREASADYIAALDASKLMYSTYDAEGNAQKIDLSAAALYNYSPYKNQYTLVNTSNQILVSSLEAANFVETKNLYEFLDRYGLVDTVAMKERKAAYDAANTQYNADDASYKTKYDEYKVLLETYNTAQQNHNNDLTRYYDIEYLFDQYKAKLDGHAPTEEDKKYKLELIPTPEGLKKDFMAEEKKYGTEDANGNVKLDDDAQYYYELAQYNYNLKIEENLSALYYANKTNSDELLKAYENNGYATEDDGTYSFLANTNAEYYYNLACYYEGLEFAQKNAEVGELFKNLVADDNGAAHYCYGRAMAGNVGCYKHLIAHLLDWGGGNTFSGAAYTTILGEEFYLDATSKSTGAGMHDKAKDNYYNGFKPIIESINNTDMRLCDGNDEYEKINYNLLANDTVTDKDRLMSDYYFIKDENGKNYGDDGYKKTYAVKSVKQKLIDTLFLLQNQDNSAYTLSTEEMQNLLKDLTEGDLSKVSVPKKPENQKKIEEPKQAAPTCPVYSGPEKPEEPKAPKKPAELTNIIILNDQAKGQWYVNLWYAMNGSDTANVVSTLSNEEAFNAFTTTKYAVLAASKNEGSANYAIFDDNLYKSAEWLQFALEQGIVTIQKATVFDPSEDNGKVLSASGEGIMWSRTPYTSCTDFVEVDDEVAIARAEAEYNQKLNDIQAQDKKLDNDLKKLDTEHNALQTEYESVKSVVNKNIERSFKAFS